ncbi:TetR/AcrR family transcriptional regulator [Paenibacillus sp. NPDC058071]|uniref:TetR/AcrR family transcriptional regulator n=1 Tax=Paenibacillus sp. NPDC058071 TaxID=3346326 RepID=UPI0036DBFD54
MSEKKLNDRRILRTKMILREALLQVLSVKIIEQITVSDITEAANINRSTFYLHYQDKEELIATMIAEKLTLLQESMNSANANHTTSGENEEPDTYLLALFQHFSDHERFYRIMFDKNGEFINAKLYEVIRESHYHRTSSLNMEQKMLVPLDIFLDYITSAILGLIHKWFDQQMVYSPRYMSIQLTRLAYLGTNKVMGIESSN